MKAQPEELETAAVYAPISDLHQWEDFCDIGRARIAYWSGHVKADETNA